MGSGLLLALIHPSAWKVDSVLTASSGSRLTLNGKPVVAIGVDRGGACRDNSPAGTSFARLRTDIRIPYMPQVLDGCMMLLLQPRPSKKAGR
jgi:hypothetical protein